MKPIKNRTSIGTFWQCTMKRKIPTNPRTDLVLTVENLSCNKGILQDTRRYTEKETRTTLLSPQVFCFVWSFPLFSFSPTGEVQQPVERVRWGVNFGTYEKKKRKKGPSQALCSDCSEIFKNSWNLKKHIQRRHSKKVRRQNRTTVMRKVRKMLPDTELLRESTYRWVGCNQ